MPLPPITDTIRVSVEGLLPNGHAWANVLHFRKPSTETYAAAIAALDPLVFNLFNAVQGTGQPIKNPMSISASVQRIRYTPLDGITATTVIPHVVAGVSTGDALPPGVALVATLRTSARGRRNRGRIYLAGFAEATCNAAGALDAAWVTILNNQFAGWLAALAASTYIPVVASYGVGDPPRLPNWTPYTTPVLNIVVNNAFDSQRRRSRV